MNDAPVFIDQVNVEFYCLLCANIFFNTREEAYISTDILQDVVLWILFSNLRAHLVISLSLVINIVSRFHNLE